MDFTLDFIQLFMHGIALTAPLLLFFALLIVVLGQIVGRRENWSRLDALYWSFITATTVGYGDFRPTHKYTKTLSILIALFGIMFTGIIVAITINTATLALKAQTEVSTYVEQSIEPFVTTLSPSLNPFQTPLTQAMI